MSSSALHDSVQDSISSSFFRDYDEKPFEDNRHGHSDSGQLEFTRGSEQTLTVDPSHTISEPPSPYLKYDGLPLARFFTSLSPGDSAHNNFDTELNLSSFQDNPVCNAHAFNTNSSYSPQCHSYNPRAHLFNHPRAHSQPPAEPTFHRSGHFLGRPTGSHQPFQHPSSTPTTPHLPNRRSPSTPHPRPHPYASATTNPATKQPNTSRRSRRLRGNNSRSHSVAPSPAPTSAPRASPKQTPADMPALPPSPWPSDPSEAERWQFGQYRDQTTLALGILSHVERLASTCEEMRAFVTRGFGEVGAAGGVVGELEGLRLERRNENSTLVRLDETLYLLPRFVGGEIVLAEEDFEARSVLPRCGRQIGPLEHASIDSLLAFYDIPFDTNMFLHEKKLLYLRFIGASRALMREVLD